MLNIKNQHLRLVHGHRYEVAPEGRKLLTGYIDAEAISRLSALMTLCDPTLGPGEVRNAAWVILKPGATYHDLIVGCYRLAIVVHDD